jgi:KDO2-lipid IV(A) lauroyltransferase
LNGSRVIPKKRAVREIIKGLNKNEIVGILADQDGGRNGVFVNFFGRKASTPEGAIAFALKTGCAVLPTFIIREDGARHTFKIEPPIHITRSGNYEMDIKTNLQTWTDILESYIRRYPEQWLWIHKRWKTQPEES